MQTHPESTHQGGFAEHLGQTFRHFTMWTVPLVLSLICLAWGLGSLLMGRVGGPAMMSWTEAAFMSVVGLLCFCYVLVGDYLHDLGGSIRGKT